MKSKKQKIEEALSRSDRYKFENSKAFRRGQTHEEWVAIQQEIVNRAEAAYKKAKS